MAYGAYVKSFGSGLGRYKGGNYKTRAQVEKQSEDAQRRRDIADNEQKRWENMGRQSWK